VLSKCTQYTATNVSLVNLEFECDLEGEEQLVFLEDARAAVVVDVERVSVGDVTQSLRKVSVRQTLVQRVLEHLDTQVIRQPVNSVEVNSV